MKARWTMVAALVAVVVAALALAGAASAQSRYTHHVLHLDETYVDPHWSSTCGFDVVEHDEGVLVFYWNIVGKRVILDQFSVRSTLTNPETGTSVIVIGSARDEYFTWVDTLTEFKQRFTFVGLNYKVLGADGTGVSAGRFSYTFDVTLDEEGHIIDESFKESQTPHLLHLFGSSTEAAICETLAQ